jgi:hypothetical protein
MRHLLSTIAILIPLTLAQVNPPASQPTIPIDPNLVGTWTTKSKKVVTGPAFYDPANDKMIEPQLPGISYSFTQDGHFEEAYYRAIANRMWFQSYYTKFSSELK